MAERIEDKLVQLVKVELTCPENFTKIVALLRRVGINPFGTKHLYQTCHILRRGNDFYICHFKELFWVDGRENGMDKLDIERRNRIVTLLVERALITVDTPNLTFAAKAKRSVRIVPYSEIEQWSLRPKYRFKPLKRIEPTNGTIN